MHEKTQPKELHTSKEQKPKSFQIAIDGTVAAGKGSVSRKLAERLNFLYVDTGAMYRCVAYLALSLGISPNNEKALVKELRKHTIHLEIPEGANKDGRLITVLLDGEDVSWKIRTEAVSALSSIVAQHPKIRKELVRQQQKLAEARNVVMEGRDITHTVLPNAQIKIYLDADPKARAQRKFNQLRIQGMDVAFDEILKEILIRDKRDMEKNLKKVKGVWEIDSTKMTIQEVIDLIYQRAKIQFELK